MGRYIDLSRRALGRSPVTSPYEINEIIEESATDPYQERARKALNQICRPDYPTGLVPWLGNEYPSLYQELTCTLPDEIHHMWIDRVSIPEFERVLELWLIAHQTACELYHRAHAWEKSPVDFGELVK